MAITARIVFNGLPALAAAMQEKQSAIVRKTAFDIQKKAQENAHVRTGSMRASVYVATSRDNTDSADTYAQATGAAEGLNPKAIIVPEAALPSAGIAAVVGVGVKHGVYEEAKAGHEFLLPAAEQVRPEFEQAMRDVAS